MYVFDIYLLAFLLTCHTNDSDFTMRTISCTIAYMFNKTDLKLEDYLECLECSRRIFESADSIHVHSFNCTEFLTSEEYIGW